MLTLAGCATGPRYPESSAATVTPGDGLASVIVYRPSDTLQFALRGVRLDYDGARAASLPNGGFVVLHVPAGRHELRADVWDSPEDCELNFEVRAGETVYVRAAPRAQNPSADAREGRSTGLHGAAATPAAADGTVTIVGTALARPDRKCGGAYSLRVVDAGVALPELPNVRAAL